MVINEDKIVVSFQKIREDINNLNTRIEMLEAENIELKNQITNLRKNQTKESVILPKEEGLHEATINEIAKIKQKLTMSEQEIVMCLVESNEALTYKQLSTKLGKAPTTIKGQIVNMINKGLPIESTTTIHNQKAYIIKQGFERKFALTPNRYEIKH